MNQEDKEYLKTNLKIDWYYQNGELYLCLILDGEIISKVKFEQY